MFAIANQSCFVRICLRLFIASIAASALIGAIAISIPADNWWFLSNIFATTLIIAATSVCGLACGGCMLLGKKFLPTVGLACVLIASSFGLYEIWIGIDGDQWVWNFFGVVTAYGVACSHLSMLMMVKLHRSYRWAHIVAYQVILGLATLFSAGLVFDFVDNDAVWRLIGVLSIASAAITLIIPVLWRLSRDLNDHEVAHTDSILKIDEEIARCKKELMDLQAKRLRLLDAERAEEASPFSNSAS